MAKVNTLAVAPTNLGSCGWLVVMKSNTNYGNKQ